ncbi:MAG: DUF177 domain-containing protein [Alphaproteobacteria bacterium]|nr:DUF177 domain-containing protein [Alphaproteobacteria bacterium]MBV9372115.1 DUF177 domain-containing protein [Alphaproteobacteria bacterium]MBV9899853.1 DUF177 domain-containing protein [Alphaproteobacteria bacterium]
MTPEFSRPLRLDTLAAEPRSLSIEADEAERAALAQRFGLVSVDSLAAEAALVRHGDAVTATGRLEARVTQSCVATAEPVPQAVSSAFRIEFRPPPQGQSGEEEVELSESELDVVFYDGAAIDLGEAVAETLSLNLDPYPRAPGADAALREAGVRTEEEAKAESNPFAALAGLRDKLEK